MAYLGDSTKRLGKCRSLFLNLPNCCGVFPHVKVVYHCISTWKVMFHFLFISLGWKDVKDRRGTNKEQTCAFLIPKVCSLTLEDTVPRKKKHFQAPCPFNHAFGNLGYSLSWNSFASQISLAFIPGWFIMQPEDSSSNWSKERMGDLSGHLAQSSVQAQWAEREQNVRAQLYESALPNLHQQHSVTEFVWFGAAEEVSASAAHSDLVIFLGLHQL